MTRRPPRRARLLVALGLVLLAACAPPPERPADVAQGFWNALAAGDPDAAAALALPGDAGGRHDRLAAFDVEAATVEVLEVPAEAEVALLPTRVDRRVGERRVAVDTVTVLRRVEDVWRVDADDTRAAYRTASVDALGARLGAAAEDLRAALGRGTEDLAEELRAALGRGAEDLAEGVERFAEELDETVRREGAARSGDLADEVTRRLAAAGEALIGVLRRLQHALADGDAAPEAAPPADASPDGDGAS
jgi:hypothetical protein